jgi:hypothetical protein
MIALQTGKPYPLPVPSQEGASANFLSKNGNVLQVHINNLSRDELFALKKGRIDAGFLYERGDLLWMFRFYDKKGPVFTLDSPFDVRLIPGDLLTLHDIVSTKQRLVIDIHVVDNDILRVLRSVTMPNRLTIEFLSAVQDQLAEMRSGDAMSRWMISSVDELCKEVTYVELGK